jgi:3-mercaptopyruvate sulfurtransferase SseA
MQILPAWPRKTDFRLPGPPDHQETLCCTLPEVKGAIEDPHKVVIDARSEEEYLGSRLLRNAAKPGRIPGVTFIPWQENLIREGPFKGYFKSSREILDLYAARGITPDKQIYIY